MDSLIDQARALNLVETVYVEGARTRRGRKPKKSPRTQYLKYILVIDFEATCWEYNRKRPSEIIEFPAVLYNLETLQIESEFQKYILPIECPELSPFCTDLTGITQHQVNNGIPLQTCLMLFNDWLKDILKEKQLLFPKSTMDNLNGNIALVSWSDWDFGICLKRECSRKSIKRPSYFNQWIDLRVIYKEWYKYKPSNFSDALFHLGMDFDGRPHCGLDDARNIAKLAGRLCKDGALLKITKDLLAAHLLNRSF